MSLLSDRSFTVPFYYLSIFYCTVLSFSVLFFTTAALGRSLIKNMNDNHVSAQRNIDHREHAISIKVLGVWEIVSFL